MTAFFSVLGIVYAFVLGAFTVFEGKIVFPAPSKVGSATPADVGLGYENLFLPVGKKGQIHAWWVPSENPNAPVILYFHGNGEILEYESDHEAALFHEAGVSQLLVEYRGYGSSSKLQTSAATTRQDALAAMQYLIQERHIPIKKIVICGWSIGTGVATQLAVDRPGSGGLILLSPITSISDVANKMWFFRTVMRPLEWTRRDNDFANKSKIGSLHLPVLLMTGTEDEIAPPWMTKELWSRANEPKRMKIIEGASHEGIFVSGSWVLMSEVKAFLEGIEAK